MPFIKILIHAVWTVKDRKPLMSIGNKEIICKHINDYANSKSIHVLNVNGYRDHLHCLISLAPEQNIATVMNLLKGESSHWSNKNLEFKEHFGWQDEYFAVSVSKSHFHNVNDYITNQEEHHKNKTFQEEYDEFIKKYEFKS
jgi:putative transposase